MLFRSKKMGVSAEQLVKHVMEVQELNSNFHETGKKQLHYISWEKPNQGWVKLNVDGASKHNPGRASAGGLIRNEYGQCIVGFSANLRHASNVAAELWAMLIGLQIAWNSGYRKIVIESYSKTAVSLLELASKESLH